MEASFVPFNANVNRLPAAQTPQAVPLHPASPAIEMPDGEKAFVLPGKQEPAPFSRSFKDIYLDKREELRKSAEGMESIMVRQALKAMRSSIPQPEDDEDLFGTNSHATQMFMAMMDDELADKIAANGEFGIADHVFKSQINGLTQEFATQLEAGQQFGIKLRR